MLDGRQRARRDFLRYLALSPLAASLRGDADEGEVIAAVGEAINVFDFREVAKKKLPPAHYGYLATGAGGDSTTRANRRGFDRYSLRVRRLVDVREIDTSVEILGARWASPISLAPIGNQAAFHPGGVGEAAYGAKAADALQILSTVANTAVEDVVEARGEPVWFQLYPTERWEITRALLKRAEGAGCPAVALTVDALGSNRETLKRWAKKDQRDCRVCHNRDAPNDVLRRKPLFADVDLAKMGRLSPLWMTWDYVRRLRDATSMKLLIKGIVTREDAELAVESGVDGIIVSNHGGRSEPSGRGTIESLPEVVEGAAGRIPVLMDGGIRRGTDVFKALALGADAVAMGRPYCWGLAAFGREGVEASLRLVQKEFALAMRQAGTVSVDKITRAYLAST